MRTMISGAALLLVGATSPAERVVSGDALVPVTVNGRALRLHVEPSMPGLALVAPALAPKLGLKKPGFFGIGVAYHIGQERVYGATQVVRFGWAAEKAEKRRLGWMSRVYTPVADGTIGPGGLPEPVIRFQLRTPRAGETTVAIPMTGGTGLFGGWFVLDGMATVAGLPTRIRFDPARATSLVNASAAVAIAAAHAGVMTAETGRQEIAFGVDRPYRVMKLEQPLAIGSVSLSRLGVRVTDGNVAGRIAEEGAAAEAADPDEVVVTAKGRKPRNGLLILGADALVGCSTLVFDKPARVIRLSCGVSGG